MVNKRCYITLKNKTVFIVDENIEYVLDMINESYNANFIRIDVLINNKVKEFILKIDSIQHINE